MNKKRIGVLRGGVDEHYAPSIKRGGEIIAHLNENLGEKYQIFDILVDKNYIWHLSGLPTNPGELRGLVDAVWNTSHPTFSNILQSLSIPHISPGSFSTALLGSRNRLKEHLGKIGVFMPRHIILPAYQRDFSAQGATPAKPGGQGSASGGDGPRESYAIRKAKTVFEKFGSPWVVRSFMPESGMDFHLARTFPELVAAVEDGAKNETSILVEEFISGKVASLHSVTGFRNESLYAFPPLSVFGNLSGEEKQRLPEVAKILHRHLGAGHYLKSSLAMHPRGKIYLLHFDSIPDLKPNSYFSQACESVGAKMPEAVEHILEQAMG